MQKEKDMAIYGKALGANQLGALCVEAFLSENYNFRRNILSGKIEFTPVENDADGNPPEETALTFRPLTQQALNSIIIRAKREEVVEKGSPKQDIIEYVNSEEVPLFNPIRHFLEQLPQWDGQNHVARLFERIPGISSEQSGFFATWLRSAVAHWMQMDMLHGNECVPVLIGPQGCGKTTFLRRLLPPALREYYLDHLNLSNKFDKEMALTNNLLVNLDELDNIRPSQQPALKQTLSKNKVNGRPIFGTVQEDRPRFASFVATTNNPHPLQDPTGSRRFICLAMPKGKMIDNDGDIDYEQLYAQVLYEIQELNAPYWFNNAEVNRIQQMNQEYMTQKDLAEMVAACFRLPKDGETVKSLNTTEMLGIIRQEYPSVVINMKTKAYLGRILKDMNYEQKSHSNRSYYKAVPLVASTVPAAATVPAAFTAGLGC